MVPQPTKEEDGLMPQPKENGSAVLPKEEDSLTLQPKHKSYIKLFFYRHVVFRQIYLQWDWSCTISLLMGSILLTLGSAVIFITMSLSTK